MFFNFNETSYKLGCWAIVVEALGGGNGWSALVFLTCIGREGHSLKCLDWACLFLIKIALSVEI